MKTTKKGVTLVELIICCGIIVMVGGACTAVLMSGHKIFNNSAASANAQLETDVLQTYLTSFVPLASTVRELEGLDDVDDITVNAKDCIYIDDEGTFFIRIKGKDVTVRSVTDFKYRLVPAGDKVGTRRPQFVYEVTMTDGTTYTSGFVLSNLVYDSIFKDENNNDINLGLKNFRSVSDNPVCFTPVSVSNAS